ncbi:glucose/sorbosone dehydrogenase [Cenarchaeum symbiosum A]|uniref:Glucose/sorbosone dehydrogenase n=1 Tax=Cenarchaeum symbiosum (strain A) TaxID=414004 RepID=A0RZ61_CENSY|nr:glucose/sorbosone dehydrogenase [Cenarchaeum symbiosum A]
MPVNLPGPAGVVSPLELINRGCRTISVDKRVRIGGIIAAVAISIIIITSPGEPLPLPRPTTTSSGSGSVDVLATGLDEPRHLAFYGDRVFLTEKAGRVRVVQDDVLLEEPLAVLRVADELDSGLLGIAVHPDFGENHKLYVYHSYIEDGAAWNRILQITERDNKLEDAETVLDKIPGSRFSNGGVIKFGPDGKLYVGTGSVSDTLHLSQEMDSLGGKILRINDDGSIPSDNPFEGSPVYSLGHRDPQGMAWSSDGTMYASDLGPSKNDEINVIIPGGNYGWPDHECSGGGYEDSILCFDPAIEPGGLVVYSGEQLEFGGSLIMTSLRVGSLYGFDPTDGGLEDRQSILAGLGRIRDVDEGPDGYLYALTSNTDGRGFPDRTDDKLLRVIR